MSVAPGPPLLERRHCCVRFLIATLATKVFSTIDRFMSTRDLFLTGQTDASLAEHVARMPDMASLFIQSSPRLSRIPTLPDSVKTVQLFDCVRLVELARLPESLTFLQISRSPKLTSLPELPEFLYHLELNCVGMHNLPSLPKGLTFLYLSNLAALGAVPHMPERVSYVQIENCGISTLEQVPLRLSRLSLKGCRKLKSLPRLSEAATRLQRLEILDCPALTPQLELPNSLTNLGLQPRFGASAQVHLGERGLTIVMVGPGNQPRFSVETACAILVVALPALMCAFASVARYFWG